MFLGADPRNDVFKTANTILWKSDIAVAKTEVLQKLLNTVVRNRSMHLGFSG